MSEDENKESPEKLKRHALNVYLLIIGVIVAGVSFGWHIIPLFFKN